jgi:hypothetical protein
MYYVEKRPFLSKIFQEMLFVFITIFNTTGYIQKKFVRHRNFKRANAELSSPASVGARNDQEPARLGMAAISEPAAPFFAIPNIDAAECVGFPDNGLSYRANDILWWAGIPAEQLAVRHALETGAFFPGKQPFRYDAQTHDELCRWVGLDVKALRRQVYLLGVAERRRAKKPSTKPSTISSTSE